MHKRRPREGQLVSKLPEAPPLPPFRGTPPPAPAEPPAHLAGPDEPMPKESFPDIIPHVLPTGTMHLLSGAPGAGKTTVMAQLFAALQQGKPFFGRHGRAPAAIGYVSTDRPYEDHSRWFELAGAHIDAAWSIHGDPSLTGAKIRARIAKDGTGWLLEYVVDKLWPQGVPQDSLIVLDPTVLFVGGDLQNYTTVFTHMIDLTKWAAASNCTILGVTHASKQKAGADHRYKRPQDRVSGTTAQTGTVGTTMHLAPPTECEDEDGHSELHIGPRSAPEFVVWLERGHDGLFKLVERPMPKEQEKNPTAISQIILGLVPTEPAVVATKDVNSQVALLHGLTRMTVHRHLKMLEESGAIKSAGFGRWSRVAAAPVKPIENPGNTT